MEPPGHSLTAGELAAIDQLRKKPSWRATNAVNGAPIKRLWRGWGQLPLWAAAVLLLFGLLTAS